MHVIQSKTGMLLLRMNDCWRICGVLHSDVKYMDDDFRAKPTPDKDPELSKKILTLYQLLTTHRTQLQKVQQADKTIEVKANVESKKPVTASQSEVNSTPITEESNQIIVGNGKTISTMTDSKSYFENSSMRLMLPIPVDSMQRLLMINVGDDFTHIWFPTWHKFLSSKRISEAFNLAKKAGTAIEMSQRNNNPKVFVTHSHDKCIFIGPYAKDDKQNLALFVKYEKHMILSEIYHKKYGKTYQRKTKGKHKIQSNLIVARVYI